jgi:serpin B
MRYFSCILLACFFVVLLSLSGISNAAEQKAEAVPELSMQATPVINAFAIDVYRQLASGRGNLFFSPYSIASALAMTYAGARGDTAAEMEKVLHFTEYKAGIHAAMKSLQNRFNSIPGENGIFSVANRIWLDMREELVPDYSTLVEEYYNAGVESADFFDAYEKARLEINDWVAQKTREKIKDLLQPGEITAITKLILVNAVYFNSAWLEAFDKSMTVEEPFHIEKDKQCNVQMMHRTGNLYYGENSEAQWVRIPYSMPGLSMTIFLPRENESFTQLADLEKKLTSKVIESWISDMQFREVKLSIPKFKDKSRFNLTELLQKLGMKLAFDWVKADFSGMVIEPRKNGFTLCISDAIHQAFIELDEERTEAAAATAVVMATKSLITAPAPGIIFRADHPFIYCLTDNTGTILFMGRMTDPK